MENYIKIIVLSSIVLCKICKALGEDFYAYNKSTISMGPCNHKSDKYDGYECPDGTCIKESQYCNGIVDCEGTADDEINCKRCPAGLCSYNRSGLCAIEYYGEDSKLWDAASFILTRICRITTTGRVDCTGKMMVSLPCFGHYNFVLRELILNENLFGLLDSLSDSSFQNLDQLSVLELERNQIKYLPSKVFQNCKALEELSLANNQIQHMDDTAFGDLYHLTILRLNGNKIRNLTSNVFQDLINVENLDLSANEIGYLDENVFGNLFRLEILRLNGNKIRNLTSNVFQDLISVKNLDLSANEIGYLDENVFGNLSRLEILYLNNNEITTLPRNIFRNLSSLRELYLYQNRIGNLDENIFQNLPTSTLKTIDLNQNNITTLPPNVFQNLNELRNLLLNHNRIAYLDENAFHDLSKLVDLDLGNNVIASLPQNAFQKLQNLHDLRLNDNEILDLHETTFHHLLALQKLNLAANYITNLSEKVFNNLRNLRKLSLDDNQIQHLDEAIFQNLQELEILSIRGNHITHLPVNVFSNLTKLHTLDLGNNAIRHFPNVFHENQVNLKILDMSNNRLNVLPAYMLKRCRRLQSLNFEGNAIEIVDEFSFSGLSQLSQLYLQNNAIGDVNDQIFRNMKALRLLVVDEYRFCCLKKDVKNCIAPIDDFSSCEDLMKNTILRIFVWIIGIIAICANIFVIVVRIKYQNARTNKVNLFLIVNLAISDLIMGVYLVIIATIDQIYRGDYYLHDLSWRRSYSCDFVGVLSTFSSELTVFILTVLSIDRLLSIMFPWRTVERGLLRTKILMIIVWILAAVISLVPHQIFQIPYFKNFYGRSGVCLALHITKEKPSGWEYSVSIFIFLNALSFAVIAVAYALMYYRASARFRRNITSSNRNSDTVMAFRMTLLVLADAACWIPIIVSGVGSLMGHALPPDAYAWIAVFVLPLNAALNPIIYTISSIPLMIKWKFEKCPEYGRPRFYFSWRGLELQRIQR